MATTESREWEGWQANLPTGSYTCIECCVSVCVSAIRAYVYTDGRSGTARLTSLGAGPDGHRPGSHRTAEPADSKRTERNPYHTSRPYWYTQQVTLITSQNC